MGEIIGLPFLKRHRRKRPGSAECIRVDINDHVLGEWCYLLRRDNLFLYQERLYCAKQKRESAFWQKLSVFAQLRL